MSEQSTHASASDQDQPSEAWKPISGWPYEVSDLGRIRRIKAWNGTQAGRVLRPNRRQRYALVLLHDCGRRLAVRVHILVARAFVGECPPGFQVNHKDGNKRNNAACNLEYVTMPENMRHALGHSLVRQGERHPRAKLTADDVAVIRGMFSSGATQAEIARRFGRHPATVNHIVRGRHWKNPTGECNA